MGHNEGRAIRRRTSGRPLHALTALDERLTERARAEAPASPARLGSVLRPSTGPRTAKPAPGLTLLALVVVAAVQVAWLALLILLVVRFASA